MLRLNGSPIITEWFQNNETKIRNFDKIIRYGGHNFLEFQYTADEELITLMFVKKRLDHANVPCSLSIWHMPYNYKAKKFKGDLLSHPYTREFINWLNFANVEVMESNLTVNHEIEGKAGYIASGYANLKLNGKWLNQVDDFSECIVEGENVLQFTYVTDDDLIALMFAKKRIDEANVPCILSLEYIPYSSVSTNIEGDLFVFDYICDFYKWLNFKKIILKKFNNT